MYIYKCFQEDKLLVAISTFLSHLLCTSSISYHMYMFVEPHLPNDMFPYTCIITLPLWKIIIVGISLQTQKYTYMIICTVPNITITVLTLTIVYFMSEVHCTLNVLHSITPHTIHTLLMITVQSSTIVLLRSTVDLLKVSVPSYLIKSGIVHVLFSSSSFVLT